MPRRTIWSVLAAALLCLVMLPVTALAAAPSGQVIYVGDEAVTGDGYWTTDDSGNVTAFTGTGAPTDNYIHYDTANNTLTLHNAAIKESVSFDTSTYVAGAAIGVFHQNGAAELTIQLEGTNTIAEVSTGIYVLASSNSTGDASLTITGSGSLDTSGSYNPAIRVQSNGGNAALSIENADVEATVTSVSGDGVCVQSSAGSSVSLTVDGGSLTATGSGTYGAGIRFQFGSGVSGSGTPSLTVSGNAMVRANGGIANNSSTSIEFGTGNGITGGIVFDGGEGTVYGSVTLQGDLTINEGESLDVSGGATLTVPGDVILVNRGTLNIGTGSILNNNGALGNAGTTTVDGSIQNAGQIVNAEDGSFTGVGTIVNDSSSGHGSFSNLGSVSDVITVSGNQIVNYVTKVTLDSPSLTLIERETGSLTAQLSPTNATYQGVSWSSSDESVATVAADPSDASRAIVTAAGPGTATITARADNGNGAFGNDVFATCTVTVLEKTTVTDQPGSITVDAGTDATFSVTATGSGSLAYQWQASTDDGDTWTDVPGATSSTYTVESVTEDMSGTWYRCVVTGGDGGVATSEPATLTVAHVHRPASEWSSDEDGHWHACETCGDRLDSDAHTPEIVDKQDATCTDEGYTGDTVCSVCGHVIAKGEAVPATGHSWGAWDVSKPATCTEDGLETRTCAACGETENRTAPASGHAWGEPAWSWSDDGSSATAAFTCENDSKHVQRPEVTVSSEVLLAPTCTEAGTTRYTATVELGGQTYTSTKDVADIPATDHSFTSYVPNGDATCTEDGTETAACDNGCGATDTRTDEGSALGHELVRVDEITATCTEPGTREHWECARCDALFADEDGTKPANADELAIPATGHSPAAAWSSDESGHWHACENGCGTRLDAAAHAPETTGEKDAACTDEGYTGDTACSACGRAITKGETVPAFGHDWGEPEWSWSEDGTSFVATFACAHDASHVTELMAKPTSEVVSKPTCTEPGVTRYYAEVELDGVTYAAESTAANVPALGHDFENGTCTVCGAKEEGYIATEEPKEPEQTPEPSDPEPTVPETGDVTASFSLALGVLGAAALGASALARRRG